MIRYSVDKCRADCERYERLLTELRELADGAFDCSQVWEVHRQLVRFGKLLNARLMRAERERRRQLPRGTPAALPVVKAQ